MASTDLHHDVQRALARQELHAALRAEVRQALEETLRLHRVLEDGADNIAACDIQLLAQRFLRAARLARAAEGGSRLRVSSGGTA